MKVKELEDCRIFIRGIAEQLYLPVPVADYILFLYHQHSPATGEAIEDRCKDAARMAGLKDWEAAYTLEGFEELAARWFEFYRNDKWESFWTGKEILRTANREARNPNATIKAKMEAYEVATNIRLKLERAEQI